MVLRIKHFPSIAEFESLLVLIRGRTMNDFLISSEKTKTFLNDKILVQIVARSHFKKFRGRFECDSTLILDSLRCGSGSENCKNLINKLILIKIFR